MTIIRGLTTAFVLALAVWGSVPVALAQAPAQAPATPPAPESKDDALGDMISDVELTRAAIQVRRQALVTVAMDLDAKEADAFWPLYREYRVAMAEVGDRFVKLLTGYLGSYDNLTEESAGKMMDEYLKIERARNSVKVKFVPRFTKAITARKAARFFQLDHKLDTVINAELARVVPLAR